MHRMQKDGRRDREGKGGGGGQKEEEQGEKEEGKRYSSKRSKKQIRTLNASMHREGRRTEGETGRESEEGL